MPKLSGSEETEVKECFDLFDRDGSGKIDVSQLGKIIRSVGQTPSNQEVTDYIKEIDPDGSGTFDYPSLIGLLDKHWKAPQDPKAVIEAFKIFDPDSTGKIKTGELRTVMSNLGEKLTNEEVQAMLKEADPNNSGMIDYSEFVNNMHQQTQGS